MLANRRDECASGVTNVVATRGENDSRIGVS